MNEITLREQSELLISSGFLPPSIKTVSQAYAVCSLGQELGLKPWQSLRTIYPIPGKGGGIQLVLKAEALLALCERSGELEDSEITSSPESASCTLKRKNRSKKTVSYTLEDAKKQGLTGKDNWQRMPETMLRWRAVASCCRLAFADVTMGLYAAEEFDFPQTPVQEEIRIAVQPPQGREAAHSALEDEIALLDDLENEDRISPKQIQKLWVSLRERLPQEIAEPWLRAEYAKFTPPVASTRDLCDWQFQAILMLITNITGDEIEAFTLTHCNVVESISAPLPPAQKI